MSDQRSVDLQALSDLCTPWCLHVVATLRIAEQIAAGTEQVADLAAATGSNQATLHQVLSHLVSRGVFVEPQTGRLQLNDAARGLLDSALHLQLDLGGIGGRLAHIWSTLPSYVRTGRPAYADLFGRPFWDDLEANPAIAASFDAMIGPAGHGEFDSEIPLTGGWSSVRSVVDVGGGTGAMLAALLRRWPALRGTLVDLPRTVSRAEVTFQAAGVADRASLVGQSFFEPLPAGADVYMLRGVLNDWPDPEAGAILARCAEAARPAGRVIVLKGIGPDGAPGGLTIEMLLAGGRYRSLSEFHALARAAGLEVVADGRQPSGIFVVECRPI
jgi:SAM-dependent methyltransferase